jgi:hypothetical protein
VQKAFTPNTSGVLCISLPPFPLYSVSFWVLSLIFLTLQSLSLFSVNESRTILRVNIAWVVVQVGSYHEPYLRLARTVVVPIVIVISKSSHLQVHHSAVRVAVALSLSIATSVESVRQEGSYATHDS